MKPTKKFWLWCLAVIAFIILAPPLITVLFILSSNYIHPIFFIGALVLVAAVISYYGGIGRS